mgnify:CR=1 FL=1
MRDTDLYLDNNGDKAPVSDTFENWHTYEIDWKPDSITWSIDGEVVRVKNKSETWNETSNRFEFPQTPSRVQLSIWPAGLPSNGEGTIEWAGGLVDWDSEDIKEHGYYYATFGDITMECYDPPAGANIQGNKSYIYTDYAATNNTVEITNKPTVLKSFLATGTNMSADYPSGTATPTVGDDTVPGIKGGVGSDAQRGSATSSGSGSQTTGFTQDSSGQNGASSQSERVLKGSLFAVLVAVVVLVTM